MQPLVVLQETASNTQSFPLYDSLSVANSGAVAVSSLTWSHTTAGTNRLLVVGLSWTGTATTISTITYAGAAPTSSITTFDATTAYHSKIWWWTAPTTGANNIVVTPSIAAGIYGGGTSFTNTDQTTPVPDTTSTTGSSFGLVTTPLTTSNAAEVVFSHFAQANNTTTITASQMAQMYNQGDSTLNRTAGGAFVTAPAATATNTNWIISGATARSWAVGLVGIKAFSAPTPPSSSSPTLLMMGI